VSVTYTLNNSFGSGATAEGLGILLNDEMDDFTSKVGAPNMFGLDAGSGECDRSQEASLVQHDAHHRASRINKVRFVIGSPGGPRIITTVANIF
jgi:gamma-glutamyltranspeptidase/glutathione hydrolase